MDAEIICVTYTTKELSSYYDNIYGSIVSFLII